MYYYPYILFVDKPLNSVVAYNDQLDLPLKRAKGSRH